jgi:hypothetical protein
MFNKYTVIALFHSIIVAPLLIYIGYEKEFTNKNLFNILLIFGILTLIYHLISLYNVSMTIFIITIFILGILFGLSIVTKKENKIKV